MTAYALLVWTVGGLFGRGLYPQLLLFGASVYVMVEFNNSNALLNMYSRMVSASFIALTMTAPFIFGRVAPWAVQLCLAAAFLTLTRCYQDRRAPGTVFYAFAFIGVASVIFIQALFLVPALWALLGASLMALSWRNFWASLLGLAAPWWFLAGWHLFLGDPLAVASYAAGITQFDTPLLPLLADPRRALTLAFTAAVAITGTVHCLRNSRKEKIRTRMICNMLITMTLLMLLFIILQPRHFDMLFPMLTVCASALIARYISQTNTRLTNISFYLMTLAAAALTAYNLWL